MTLPPHIIELAEAAKAAMMAAEALTTEILPPDMDISDYTRIRMSSIERQCRYDLACRVPSSTRYLRKEKMSTGIRLDYQQAHALAHRFRDLFPLCYEQWEVAGSIRRQKQQCGDAEHVCVSRIIEVRGDDLFATPRKINAVWNRLEELEKAGAVRRHVYGDTGFRWGERYRGVEFKGVLQEIYQADADNYGSTLAIRTGAAEFSQKLVTGLLRNGRRNYKGYVWECERCPDAGMGTHSKACAHCDGTSLKPIVRLPAPDEESYFKLCAIPFVPPEKR